MRTIHLATVAAIMSLVGLESTAEAIDVYASGSSTARQFINEIPLSVCNNAQPITHYSSSDRNMHLWKCTFNGELINFHYSARGSADGIYPVDDLTGGDFSKGRGNGRGYFAFIRSSNPATSGCGALFPVNKTFYDVDSGTIITQSIQENTTCINPPSSVNIDWSGTIYDRVSTHFGFSDVQFTSFGQVSPGGSQPAYPAPNVQENHLMVLPLSIVVQNSVRRVDSAGNNLGPVQNLTQTEIEQIFSRRARDWRELGYAVTNDVAGTQAVPSGPHDIRLCMREFGSGSKAAFDQVLMKEDASEWNLTTANITFYGASSFDVERCLNNSVGIGLFGKIGYIDSFDATAPPAYITVAGFGVANAHVVNIDGFRGVDAKVMDPVKATARPKVLRGLRCGQYEFWVKLNGYTKTAGTGHTTRDAFIARMVSDAQNTQVIENLPANWAFEATQNLLATKAGDNFAPNPVPYSTRAAEYDAQCRDFYGSPAP